jgi:ATP-dependent Clp protease protease subunit
MNPYAMYVPNVIEKTMNGERSWDIFSSLLQDRIVYLGTQIDDVVANIVIGQLLYLESIDPGKPINMYINSPGGVVTAGMGIYDTMNYISAPVSTVCIGQAASMGAFLLSSGEPGMRVALPHARIMIHQPLGGAQGQATDIMIQAAEILRMKKELTEILANNTQGVTSFEKMTELCERDYYMSADHTKELGLIDIVLKKTGVSSSKETERFTGAVGH